MRRQKHSRPLQQAHARRLNSVFCNDISNIFLSCCVCYWDINVHQAGEVMIYRRAKHARTVPPSVTYRSMAGNDCMRILDRLMDGCTDTNVGQCENPKILLLRFSFM